MLTAKHFETVLRSVPGAMGRQVASLDVLAKGANEALAAAPQPLTVKKAAAFLATLSQESGSFRYLEEISKTGPYRPYIGRTFEQVTWKSNYAEFGKWCKAHKLVSDEDIFVKDFKSLANIKWAWLGGIWFWEKNKIWAYADDFLKTQKAVNLGNPNSKYTPAGMVTRNQWYQAWLKLGDDLLLDSFPEPEGLVDDLVKSDKFKDFVGVAVTSADVIPNEFTSNTDNENVTVSTALVYLSKQSKGLIEDLAELTTFISNGGKK